MTLCLLLATARAGATEPKEATAEEKLDAAMDVIEAAEVEIRHLRLASDADQALIKKLTEERNDAFERAKDAPTPVLPPILVAVVAFGTGAFVGAYFFMRVSH